MIPKLVNRKHKSTSSYVTSHNYEGKGLEYMDLICINQGLIYTRTETINEETYTFQKTAEY